MFSGPIVLKLPQLNLFIWIFFWFNLLDFKKMKKRFCFWGENFFSRKINWNYDFAEFSFWSPWICYFWKCGFKVDLNCSFLEKRSTKHVVKRQLKVGFGFFFTQFLLHPRENSNSRLNHHCIRKKSI